MALRSLSLCAGIGGIDLGLAGHARTVCYVEREGFAAAVLAQAMRAEELDEAPIWSDLRTFDARSWTGAVDLVVAGYPCQPFSVAGKQLGAADGRYLWPDVLRIIRESGAPLAFLENVPGHLHLGFAEVLDDLTTLGLDAEWGLFSAAQVGAPHKRERLFVLAYRDGDGLEGLRRCGLLDGERQALGNDADGCGAKALAHTRRAERRPTPGSGNIGYGPDGRRQEATGGPGESGARTLGDADRSRLDKRGSEPESGTLPAAGSPGATALAHGHGHGLRLQPEPQRRRSQAAFPPGPSDRAGWERWIAAGGPQPVIRRGADGLPDRLDRLRALGNAVVPAQARLAFSILSARAIARTARPQSAIGASLEAEGVGFNPD